MGTLNLFESIKNIQTISTVIIVTTDKVYKIKKNNPFYSEKNTIGASDHTALLNPALNYFQKAINILISIGKNQVFQQLELVM